MGLLILTVQLCGFYWQFDAYRSYNTEIDWSQQNTHAYVVYFVNTSYYK